MKALVGVGAYNKLKALVGAFSRHCATSRRFVDSSSPAALVEVVVEVVLGDGGGLVVRHQLALRQVPPLPLLQHLQRHVQRHSCSKQDL